VDGMNSADIYLGHGPLQGGVQVIRALGRDSLSTRKLFEKVRSLLYATAGQTPPTLGRLF
jgi:urease accessory protein